MATPKKPRKRIPKVRPLTGGTRAEPKTRQIKVSSTEVVELKMPKGTHPVVLQKSSDTVEIIPVPKAKKQGWIKYLFGDWTK